MAVYNTDEITRLAKLLAANVRLKLEYASVANKTRKVLLVEGGTDCKFIDNIKTNIVDCVVADNVFNSNAAFRTNNTQPVNSKNAIVQLIFGITKLPSPFIVYPNDLDKWDLYGLVDLDCDELSLGQTLSRLFITDTHDLETLLMSTDVSLFSNIDNCSILEEEIKKAYFVAFQLAKTREMLGDYFNKETFDLRVISCGSCEVNFSSFVHEHKINIIDIVKYITQNSDTVLSSRKIEQMTEKILKEKSVKKKFTSDGVWKQDLSIFDLHVITDFWTSVNGHDILQLIRYYNEDARQVFGSENQTKLNRKFELALIEKYDYSMLDSTQLYVNMKAEGLIN